jgi:GTP-binding protein LepA
LGLLHMEIIQERLEREYNLTLLTTAPTVVYRVLTTKGEVMEVNNPTQLPPPSSIDAFEEPFILASVITPERYMGAILQLCQERRGIQRSMHFLDPTRVVISYELPLNEVILDFYDKLKSRTQGYASLDYEPSGYETANLVKVDILLNAVPADAFSTIVHRDKAYDYGRRMAEKLRELIPRQLFDVPIQAAIGGRIIARETVKAKRKDVLAKCYGGDISRKRKLLERQKEGKKRMKSIGRVEVPQEAFITALRLED